MRLAIVIVSFNGQCWLDKSLGSCVRYAPDVPVYVADCASQDGSADLVANNFPHAHLLRQAKNLGFAGGNNVAMRQALADGAEAIFLLNQDAELTEGCLTKLAAYLEAHPQVGAVQPGIFLADGRVNSFGNSYHYLGFGESGGNGLNEEAAEKSLRWVKKGGEPPYLSGAAVLLRASALVQVGLFDEELFLYHEDMELCLRLRLAGWKLALERGARVTHYYDHARSVKQLYFMERNRFIVWLSCFQWPTLMVLALPALAAELLMLVAATMNGWITPKLESYGYFTLPGSWRRIVERRRRVAKLRKVSDRVLLSYASATIASRQASGGVLHTIANALGRLGWAVLYPLIRW